MYVVGGVIAHWYSAGLYELNNGGFESRQELGIFLFITASRPTLGPTQSPIKWAPEGLSLRVKWPVVRLTTHLPLVLNLKSAWSYTSTPPHASMSWCTLKARPPIQWVSEAFFLRVKRPAVRLTTHLPLAPRLRMRGAIPPLPIHFHVRGTHLKHRDNFYLYY
jgi:hypothetical protein